MQPTIIVSLLPVAQSTPAEHRARRKDRPRGFRGPAWSEPVKLRLGA